MNYIIRPLTTYQEMQAVHQLQQSIWGVDDPAWGLYPPLLLTATKNGGVLLGAFETETDQMVAFLFGFLGREGQGPYKLCSQTMGVLPDWRRQGIAEALKQAQRRQVIAQELPLITWTYDPLEGPNAHLNLHKLRAVSRTYLPDVYGSNFGTLNAGLPTDRLLTEWWVNGSRLEKEPDETYEEQLWDASPIFDIAGEGVTRWIIQADLSLDDELLLLETPADIHPVKAANMELAFDWRLKVRKAMTSYFAKGYLAVDFLSTLERGQRRNRYVLQKSSPALLAAIGCEV